MGCESVNSLQMKYKVMISVVFCQLPTAMFALPTKGGERAGTRGEWGGRGVWLWLKSVAVAQEHGHGPVASLNGRQHFFDVRHRTIVAATSLVPENGWGVSQAGCKRLLTLAQPLRYVESFHIHMGSFAPLRLL